MLTAAAAAIVFLAGILRGMTGFGFSLLAVMGIGQFWPLELVTPTVLMLELVLTVLLIGDNVRPHIDLRWLVPMTLGGVFGAVAGLYGVGALPAAAVKPVLNLAIFVSALISLVHARLPALATPLAAGVAGFLVGTLVSAFAVGGPFAVVWFLAIGAAPAVIRANVIVFFGVLDLFVVGLRAAQFGLSTQALQTTALLTVPAVAGAFVGGRLFRKIDAGLWRRIAAWSIAAAAAISLIRSLFTA